jgi:hypothetical protein
VLAPLDERPVNTRYPRMIGAIGGTEVLLPPEEIRGLQRIPADVAAVGQWLATTGALANATIASVEYIGYGNLINSRISPESITDVLPRLAVLETLGRSGKPVYAFNLITRIPNADDCVEEPLYWAEYGTRLHRYSQLLHRQASATLSPQDTETLESLEEQVPTEVRMDWLNRRLRNHAVNLSLMDLLARERIAFLLVTSDDTTEWGLASQEKSWLEHWMTLLSPRIAGNLLIHPGADEVGSALVARLVCQLREQRPAIFPIYAVPGGENIVAPYEDRPVHLTVEGQIRACGAERAKSMEDADILLAVLPPSPRRTEFRTDFADSERRARQPYYTALFTRMARWQREGRCVALGDVSYPNGADPLALEMLLASDCAVDLGKLASYGGWNTAGNTLGTVVAQAVCSLFRESDLERQEAQHRFLAHRFVEDYGYQAKVRREARAFCAGMFGHQDPNPESVEEIVAVCAEIEAGLNRVLTEELQPRGVGIGLSIKPGSVRLPWRRTFEVDFELE